MAWELYDPESKRVQVLPRFIRVVILVILITLIVGGFLA